MSDTTLARIFWDRVEKSGSRPAQQFKQGGAWRTLTWREVGEAVREIAAGLVALGRRPGDAVGILSTSRAESVQAEEVPTIPLESLRTLSTLEPEVSVRSTASTRPASIKRRTPVVKSRRRTVTRADPKPSTTPGGSATEFRAK